MKNSLASTPAICVPAPDGAFGWRGQFARPTGFAGRLAGHLMALRNKQRSWWVLPLLDIHEDDRVLEVGFGSGMDIRRVSEMAIDGFVAGVDHSEVMVEQARKRNAAAIRAGRVEIRHAEALRLPYADESFHKIFSINVAQFWNDPVEVLEEMRRVLRSGGLIAVAVQPRRKTRPARETGQLLVEWLRAARFSDVRLESKRMKPAAVMCALAVK
ncbi:MAG TPA: class I SAM-dependent methyltransferase [Bryobacteraceae bacterium]|nr:class I SAM-dependent methyltransferase [Bryobacteraceae bacterium]